MEKMEHILFQLKVIIMIDITNYKDIDEEVIITCIDGQVLMGTIGAIEDEEESGLGELGLTLYSENGGYIGIGQSEIDKIEIYGKR